MRNVRSRLLRSAALLVAASFVLSGCTVTHHAPVAYPASRDARTRVLLANLRAHVKHVFVIYEENESFDHYFGTYPGADNLASAQARTHGFRQWDPIGHQWVTPFRITDPDIASTNHSRPALLRKMNGGRMDRFVEDQAATSLKNGYDRSDAHRKALLTMSYYDCDTIPFLWMYARHFALYDHIFQAMTGPSTPGNIALIAAQTGTTQWARDRAQADAPDDRGPGEPVVDDAAPPYGPFHGKPPRRRQHVQRYATVMLTLSGARDAQATVQTRGVRRDLAFVARSGRAPIGWEWYQEGYRGADAPAAKGYEAHHNALQYFGYLRENRVFWNHVHRLHALLPRLRNGTLPDRSVTFIKGSSHNGFGWKPASADPFVQRHFLGDDDHPGTDDSDRQVAESFVATFVNAIARSRYWHDSAIVILWDDEGGFYDHVPPPQFERCPDGNPCGDGPRIPFLLVSPYARSGRVMHTVGDTSSVVRFLDVLFDLPALATLPDERPYLPYGPRDANAALTNLVSGFDPLRLAGTRAPIAASQAEVAPGIVNAFPAAMNCASLGIHPVAVPGGLAHPPPGFAPRAAEYFP